MALHQLLRMQFCFRLVPWAMSDLACSWPGVWLTSTASTSRLSRPRTSTSGSDSPSQRKDLGFHQLHCVHGFQ